MFALADVMLITDVFAPHIYLPIFSCRKLKGLNSLKLESRSRPRLRSRARPKPLTFKKCWDYCICRDCQDCWDVQDSWHFGEDFWSRILTKLLRVLTRDLIETERSFKNFSRPKLHMGRGGGGGWLLNLFEWYRS